MSDAIADVKGTVDIFEGTRLGKVVGRRIMGWRRFAPVAWWLSLALVGLAWQVLKFRLFADDDVNDVVYAEILIGLFVAFPWLYAKFLNRNARRKWWERGVADQLEVSYALTSEGLKIASPRGLMLLYWQWLNEVIRYRNYWLIVGPGMAYYIPRRLFASTAQERAFLTALLDRLPEPARQRSGAAATFVAALPKE